MQAPRILKNPALFIPVAVSVAGVGFYRRWFYIGWLGVLLSLVTIRLAQVSRRDGGFGKALSGCFFPTLILIVGGAWVLAVFARIVGSIVAGTEKSWALAAFVFVSIPVLHIGSGRLYELMTRGVMGRRAGEVSQGTEPEPAAKPPASDIEFCEYTAASELPGSAECDRIAHRFQHPSSLLFYRGLMVALLVGLLMNAPLSYWLSRQPSAQAFDRGGVHIHLGEFPDWKFYFLMQVPSTLLALVLASLVFYERGRIGWVTVSLCIALASLWKLPWSVMFAVGARWAMLVPPTLMFAIVCAFFAVAVRRAAGWEDGAAARRHRLVVLRVFGVFGNTQSLFRLVTARWRCAGPVLTIADPGYARLQFAQGRFLVLLAALAPLVLIFSLVAFSPKMAASFLPHCGPVFVAIYVPLLAVYFAREWWTLRERFAHNAEAIRERISFESGRQGALAAEYKQSTLFCFDDTWKPALTELAGWADVVLMDLRAFTREHQGCQYELGFLIDRFPLNRAVFLVSETTDRELLRAVLSQRWQTVAISSPNRAVDAAPTASLYRCSAKLRRDLPQIVRLLAYAAANACHVSAPYDRAPVEAQWLQNAIRAAVGLIVLGIVLEILFEQNARHIYSGISVAWIGAILMMLATRMRTMLERDGHFRNIFRGFPWPQAFCLVAGLWVFVYIY